MTAPDQKVQAMRMILRALGFDPTTGLTDRTIYALAQAGVLAETKGMQTNIAQLAGLQAQVDAHYPKESNEETEATDTSTPA